MGIDLTKLVDESTNATIGVTPYYMPTDTYFNYQWHLNNTGQNGATAGVDIDILRVWDDYKGAGIKIGIIDDGFDLNHADLKANFNTATDYDYRRNDTNPMYEAGDAHGTTVAGVIGADNNGIGMVGVAPDAKMSGLRVSFSSDSTVAMFENALGAARNFDVVNNSWGFTYSFSDDFGASYMDGIKTAIENAALNGRGGLGTNIVFSAGNAGASGDNVNYHNVQNSPFTIAVGAVDKTGHIAAFSTPGAAVLVSAPGVEVYTTDITGTSGFVPSDFVGVSGTSFSAPVVTGVIALMLEANKTLGYRDVQEILAYSARKIDAADSGWQTNGADNFNGGGLHFSHSYGFGMVDAHTAVRLAETWGTGTGTYATMDTYESYNFGTIAIPDGQGFAQSIITVSQDLKVDRVEVILDITHANASQLDVILVSPHGTQSLLYDNASTSEFPIFIFDTVANWGESSLGDWKIQVYDRSTGTAGTLNAWAMQILGDVATIDDNYIFTDEFTGTTGKTYTLKDTDGGIDTFNASALSTSVNIDLYSNKISLNSYAMNFNDKNAIDNIFTGDGNDIITGNGLANLIKAGRGDDFINASSGADTVYGGKGNDTIYGGTSGDMLYGEDGNDKIYGETGSDKIYGGAGDDLAYGGDSNDTLYGDTGNDTLYGDIGNDYLYGGAGDDKLYGGDGDDRIWAGLDHDIIYGGAGNDLVYGEAGNDIIYGGAGDDKLYGALGNDTLIAGEGYDLLYGGGGNDTYVLDKMDATLDRIYDFSATGSDADKIDLSKLLENYDIGDAIANFVRFTLYPTDTFIKINADGQGNDFTSAVRVYGALLTGSVQSYVDSGVFIVNNHDQA